MKIEELGLTPDRQRKFTPLRDIDIANRVTSRMGFITYGPLFGTMCKISRVYTKRKHEIHEDRWCIIVSNEDYTDTLILIPYRYVVTLGGKGEYYQRKQDRYYLNDRELKLACIGILHNEYAVCEFRYKEDL